MDDTAEIEDISQFSLDCSGDTAARFKSIKRKRKIGKLFTTF
jgi:hypothetical protein